MHGHHLFVQQMLLNPSHMPKTVPDNKTTLVHKTDTVPSITELKPIIR